LKNSKTKAKALSEPKEEKPKGLSPFDFLNSINAGARGENLLKDCQADPGEGATPDSPDKKYNAFMINRGLSYFQDTILYANAMNERAHLPAVMQFDFFRLAIRPRKRFSAWAKKEADTDVIEMIMAKYDYSSEKARAVLHLFGPDEIEKLKQERSTGGTGNKKK
jgi:hypothetical protein